VTEKPDFARGRIGLGLEPCGSMVDCIVIVAGWESNYGFFRMRSAGFGCGSSNGGEVIDNTDRVEERADGSKQLAASRCKADREIQR
jgi:hypothetical protein